MIRHIITLIWNQWRSNLWVVAELFVVFIVIWFMMDTFLMQAVLSHRPVGFDTEHVYEAKLSVRSKDYPGYIEYEEGSDEPLRNFERMVERIERYPGVEAVAVSSYSLPYTYSMSMNGLWRDTTTRADARMMQVTSGFFKVFDLHGVSGETPEVLAERLGTYDDKRITLSARLAQKLFGRTNVIGDSVRMGRESETVLRIAAVTEPVRSDEYDEERYTMAFMKFDYAERAVEHKWAEKNFAQMQIIFRVRPEADAPDFAERFEQEMKRQLQAGNLWVSGINSYAKIRADYLAHSDETTIRKLYTALGTFFLVNVFLAVIGTFWFRVNRRMGEIGLRMAMGSSRSGVRRLMTGEGLMLLTLATVPALLVCLNLAVAEVFSANVMPMTAGRFWAVSGVTYLSLALIIVLAIWYPSRKASRLEPAEALHYE